MSRPTKTRSVELQHGNGKPSGAVDHDGLHQTTCRWRVVLNGGFVIRAHQRLSLTVSGGRKNAEGGLWTFGPRPSLQTAQVKELPGSSESNVPMEWKQREN